MSESTLLLARLLTTLGNLAAEPDAQETYLTSIGTEGSADELALEFDDAYRALEPHLGKLDVPNSAIERLAQLDALLVEMSGPQHAELWTPDALQTSDKWSTVRHLAGDVVLHLGRG